MARRRARPGPELRAADAARERAARRRRDRRRARPVRPRARLQRPLRLRRGGAGRGGVLRAAALRARPLRRGRRGPSGTTSTCSRRSNAIPASIPPGPGCCSPSCTPSRSTATAAGSRACSRIPASGLHRMTAIGHAHLDTAWLWPLEETWRKLVRTTTSQLRLMDAYPEHRFAHSQAQHYAWLAEREPGLFARVRAGRRARPVDPGRRDVGGARLQPAFGRVARPPAPVRPALLRAGAGRGAAPSCGSPTSSATRRSSRS